MMRGSKKGDGIGPRNWLILNSFYMPMLILKIIIYGNIIKVLKFNKSKTKVRLGSLWQVNESFVLCYGPKFDNFLLGYVLKTLPSTCYFLAKLTIDYLNIH